MSFRKISCIIAILMVMGCAVRSNMREGIASFKAEHYRVAFIHLRDAAADGQPDAQYAIAYMYYYGRGVIENRKKAWLWMNRAARAGQPEAIAALAIIKQRPVVPILP